MKYRALGATGLMVSEVGFGGWAIGGPTVFGDTVLGWGPANDREALGALEACLEHGINFFDTADIYGNGHSEELIGQALRGKRDRVVLATKIGNALDARGRWIKDFSRSHLVSALDASLRRLRADHVDLLQLHTPDPGTALQEETFDVLEELRAAGKTRFVGISIGSLEQGELVAENGWGDSIQLAYNLLERGAEERVMPAAQTAEMGVVVRVPLAGGFLSGKYTIDSEFPEDDWRHDRYPPSARRELHACIDRLRVLATPERTLAQAAIQFCLRHPAVSTVVVGARDHHQVAENAAAVDAPPLTDEELALVSEVLCG